jgi:uncharacterized delta-60 repeat protein/RHS repeat-associated protein
LYFSSAGQVLEEQQSGAVVNQNVWGLGYVNDLVLRDHFTSSGSLDTTFNSSGRVTTTVGSSDIAYKTLVQGDGKIVIVGYNSTSGVVIRYNADGSLDSGFGSSGVTTLSSVVFYDAAIQSDGKIIAVGGDYSGNFVAARYNTDGTLDTSFGSSGIATVDFGPWDYANAVSLQSDGKIVLGGASGSGPGTGAENWAIVRLTTSGSLDTSFNSTGKLTLDWGSDDVINGITVQDSGKIVAAGLANGASGMARFTSSGALDTTFGSGGTGKVALTGDWDQSINLESLSDQRLLVSGVSAGEMVLHRFTADGLEDDTFGTSGTVTMAFGAWHIDWGYDVGVQPDGKVIVVGLSNFSGGDGFALRYNVDGTLDASFGSSGAMLVWYGSSSYSEWDYFQSVAIQKDGQIVVAGTADGKFALARMNGGLTRLYAQQDANYNVTALADVSGYVKQRFIDSPYGVTTVLSPTWGTMSDGYAWQYTFQGGRYDPATGMIRFGARDFKASMGTWTEPDPVGYVGGADRYQAFSANPISRMDPVGLWDADGHFWTVYLMALSQGMSQAAAEQLAYYTQLPDQTAEWDAIDAAARVAGSLLPGQRGNLRLYDLQIEDWLHSLTGGSRATILARRACLAKMFKDPTLNLAPWQKGFILHAWGDTYAHTDKNGLPYPVIIGHLRDWDWPDIISNRPGLWVSYSSDLFELLGGAAGGNLHSHQVQGLALASLAGSSAAGVNLSNYPLYCKLLLRGGALAFRGLRKVTTSGASTRRQQPRRSRRLLQ